MKKVKKIDEVTYEVTKVDGVENCKEVSRKTKKAAKNKTLIPVQQL